MGLEDRKNTQKFEGTAFIILSVAIAFGDDKICELAISESISGCSEMQKS